MLYNRDHYDRIQKRISETALRHDREMSEALDLLGRLRQAGKMLLHGLVYEEVKAMRERHQVEMGHARQTLQRLFAGEIIPESDLDDHATVMRLSQVHQEYIEEVAES